MSLPTVPVDAPTVPIADLDHVVLAVDDVDAAVADFRALGFTVHARATRYPGKIAVARMAFADGTALELIGVDWTLRRLFLKALGRIGVLHRHGVRRHGRAVGRLLAVIGAGEGATDLVVRPADPDGVAEVWGQAEGYEATACVDAREDGLDVPLGLAAGPRTRPLLSVEDGDLDFRRLPAEMCVHINGVTRMTEIALTAAMTIEGGALGAVRLTTGPAALSRQMVSSIAFAVRRGLRDRVIPPARAHGLTLRLCASDDPPLRPETPEAADDAVGLFDGFGRPRLPRLGVDEEGGGARDPRYPTAPLG